MGTDVLIKVYSSVLVNNLKLENPGVKNKLNYNYTLTPIGGIPISPIIE